MDWKGRPLEAASWAVLALFLLLTLIGAVRLDRASLPLLGDEATYAMQAASLAHDLDLSYERKDYDRFVAAWGQPPEGLILQSRPGSERLVYAKPPLYALVIAPFVAASPARGSAVANALMLAVAALLAARALGHRIGGVAAPLWVTAFVFASVAFAYVYWGESDLFLFAAVASGFSLVYWGDRRYSKKVSAPPQVYQGEDTEAPRGFLLRWLGAGALLGVAVVYRPVYLTLFLPALLAAWESPPDRRRRAVGGLILGAIAIAALSLGIQFMAGGDPTGYGGQRQGIYAREPFPAVDAPAGGWAERVKKEGNSSWMQAEAVRPWLDPRLAGWNLVYFLLGQNFGILPYFLPLLLGFLAFQRDRGRWAIPLAVGAAALAFLVLRPFNFTGGGALANRYFLPLYPALWFMAARPARAVWAAVVALAASPFLGPLWAHPSAYPLEGKGNYRIVSPRARQWLPYETTQSTAPGEQVAVDGGLWVKLLSHNVWVAADGKSLRLIGGSTADLLIGTRRPLKALYVELDEHAPSRLKVETTTGIKELRPVLLKPDGHVLFDVAPGKERAVHPLWWTGHDYHLYKLSLHLPGAPAQPITMRLQPARDLIQRSGEE